VITVGNGQLAMASKDATASSPFLHQVFSPQLDPEKNWYALNSDLCCSKPSVFCSTVSAKVFPEEYKQVALGNLRGNDGTLASFRWFCSHRSSEKVHVASAFGVLLGILRLKSWSNCHFMKSDYFKAVVSSINSRGLHCNSLVDERGKLAQMQSQEGVLDSEPRKHEDIDIPTPPSTPRLSEGRSPPNGKSPPNSESPPIVQSPNDLAKPARKKKRSIEQLKVDHDLSPPSKRRKVREAATAVMKSISQVCEESGDTLGAVLGECCLMTGKDGSDAQETVRAVFDVMVKEKGVQKSFRKLLSEEVWEKRVECMRVPDWIYLLFKLKSRLSDSGWQELTNLTQLGRTGVSNVEQSFFMM